jgi:hypothetical protein
MSNFGEFLSLSAANIFFAILGVVLGLIANKMASAFIKNDYSQTGKIALTLLAQFVTTSVILAAIQTWISPSFAFKWQHTTPGIFFVVGYFSVQTHLHRTLSAIAE